MYDILNIDEVNFSDVADIAGSAELILAQANRSGLFASGCINPSDRTLIRNTAKQWIKSVENVIDTLSNGDALTVTGYYEQLHKLAYNQKASSSKLDKYRLDAFESYIRGDKSVDQYALQHTISRELDRRNPKYFGRPLQWESVCIDRWYKQFRHGASLDELSDYDTLHRVSTLLTSDLWTFETRNESAFKQTLFTLHRSFLDSLSSPLSVFRCPQGATDCEICIMNYELEETKAQRPETSDQQIHYELCIMTCFSLSAANYELTNALQRFLLASSPYLSPEEYTTCDTRIREALIASKATNSYHREALSLSRTINL